MARQLRQPLKIADLSLEEDDEIAAYLDTAGRLQQLAADDSAALTEQMLREMT